MKQNNNNAGTQVQQNSSKRQRPENKDNLDSRANEEQDYKGNDVTHNKKETKAHNLHKHDK